VRKIRVCVTGANGFIGKNLITRLLVLENVEVIKIVKDTPINSYNSLLEDIDIVYHLAGVNRPLDENEFIEGNVNTAKYILNALNFDQKPVKFIMTSSIQADKDNSYGKSKLIAEEYLLNFTSSNSISTIIYRLPGVFGKWCKPNYNSVVATFCHNVAHDIPIEINDQEHLLKLTYIDDVIEELLSWIKRKIEIKKCHYAKIPVEFNITLGKLAEKIQDFPLYRRNLCVPQFNNLLVKNLYSTYLSYLTQDKFSYPLELRSDERGELFEWIKSESFGQIFVSTTKPGVTRGNHYHHTKTEKFLVIKGVAEIKFRKIDSDEVIIYIVDGNKPTVLDIPPGYTHSISNISTTELITLFWANEIFDSENPDTYFLNVV
jgi:UDP-2-acetamido-2,6-beta-L-arabino-hexul-4-ose reductase